MRAKQIIMDETQQLSKVLRSMNQGDKAIISTKLHSELQVRVAACRANRSLDRHYKVSVAGKIDNIEVERIK